MERFEKPSEESIIEIAIMFNEGKLDLDKLSDMVAMSQFIIDRLYENGNINKPSSKENEINNVKQN